MMKRFMQFLLALPIFSAMLCSCNNDALDNKAIVSFNGLKSSYQFEAIPDGKVSFTITTNVNWYLKMEGLDWIKATPGRGLASTSSQTVTIEAIPNEDSQMRTGVMTIVAGDVTKEVTLSQAAASLEPELKFVEGVAADGVFYVDAYDVYGATFKLFCNRDWTADASDMDEWAVVGPLVGNQGRYATISVKPSEPNEGDNVYGTIVFAFDGQTKELTVCHRKFVADLSVSQGETVLTKVDALSIGQTINLTVKANAEWTVTSSAAWARLSAEGGEYGESSLVLTVDPNESGSVRTASLTFDNAGKKVTLTVTQGNEYISVSESSFTIAKEGGNLALKVSSNEKWTAVCSESWISVTPASATGNADVTIKVEAAPDDDVRAGTVTFKSDDLPDIFKVVNIIQSATYIDLTVPVLFNSSNQAWNMANNPLYASSGENGHVEGPGTGRLCSYTYPANDMLYAQVVTPSTHGMTFIMPATGNITFKKIWTKDAVEFHIPVLKANKDQTLYFDFGVMGTSYAPKYWNVEISLDGGSKWESFKTGESVDTPIGAKANITLPGKSNTEKNVNATYVFSKTVEKAEIIARVICVDGTMQQNDTPITAPHKSGTFRIIGADHDYEADANIDGVVKGPKFQLR